MKKILLFLFLCMVYATHAQKTVVDYVNPFIGTSNFGTCNPGAVVPNGMMSVTPFNVMGSDLNKWDKDKRWWSTAYSSDNTVMTGFSHVNLSGVGCPDLSSLLLMPTAGVLSVDYHDYGSSYSNAEATPGYYSNMLSRYGIKTEVTATPRTSRARFTFPKGQGNILMNLGEGLTNESGATVRMISDTEIEGVKLFGNFCYNVPDAVYPLYFVMRVNKVADSCGYWKKQRAMDAEAAWDQHAGKYKLYKKYTKEISGDDIGVFYTYNCAEGDQVEVSIGISFVSTEGARKNLDAEQAGKSFDDIRNAARQAWINDLSKIEVEGGTDDQKKVFYTALYHLLIHPNILQDVDGKYPKMESSSIGTTDRNHYTVFSLWDTYRNTHPLLCLLFPDRQQDMVRSMVDKAKSWGWMPKWELYGRETNTMDGDPASIVIADTWMRGIRDFDINAAYDFCIKSATTHGADNYLRPDNDVYRQRGYLPVLTESSFAVSAALEYYMADYALSRLATDLRKTDDAAMLLKQSEGWKNYFDKQTGMIRPRVGDGSFLKDFNPLAGQNFEANPGFHEGCAWNYTFYVPFDVKGLARCMGGDKIFVEKLQSVFDNNLYDPANEPDITYPYLFSYFRGEEWRTQELTQALLAKYFRNAPDGLPGNEDTGAMSAWAIYSMMGFYPDCPGDPSYTFTTPIFDKITIHLDRNFYNLPTLTINRKGNGKRIGGMKVDGKNYKSFRISHDELIDAGTIEFITK